MEMFSSLVTSKANGSTLASLWKLFNEGGSCAEELQAAASKRIASPMSLASQSLPIMLIVLEDIAVHVKNSCVLYGAFLMGVSCY